MQPPPTKADDKPTRSDVHAIAAGQGANRKVRRKAEAMLKAQAKRKGVKFSLGRTR